MTNQAPIGRPRSFNADDALRQAMGAFWEGGYTGTSYADLERVTKLRRQSLIYAFGDKQAIFRKALALYAADRVDEIVALLRRDGSPMANIRAVFDSWLSDVEGPRRNGCLMVNTAGELGRDDPAAATIIAKATDRLRGAIADAFGRAKALGEIDADQDPLALASLAVAAGDGALLHARVSGDASDAVRAFGALMRLLR